MDVSTPVDAQLQCTFLSGFTGSAHCTVQYGTDPTYMNLPYSAESTETGTAGDTVNVVLRERLTSSTVYYYTVSAVIGNVTVTVQGTFTTPQYSKFTRSVYKLFNNKSDLIKGVKFIRSFKVIQEVGVTWECNETMPDNDDEVY